MAVFQREVLPNGLRLLSASMPQVQSVACFIMLAAGSRYETPETSGIAHFAEHMFFKGTENRPTAQMIGNELDGIGAEFNAFTGKEYTGYYVKCAAEHRGRAFDVLVDMLRNSNFDPEEIEREGHDGRGDEHVPRDVRGTDIGGVITEPLLLRATQSCSAWDIIGRKETGPRRDARDVPRVRRPPGTGRHTRTRRSWLGPARIDPDAPVSEVAELLRAGPEGQATRRRRRRRVRGAGEHRAARVRIRAKRVGTRRTSAHGRPELPARRDPDAGTCAPGCPATVLGGGMSSRLFTEVRERGRGSAD